MVLDAGSTKDDAPGTLIFDWHQVAGIPVQLRVLNDGARAVAFVVPSSFYTVDYPGPVIRLTVIDQSGQQDTKDIMIHAKSRRHNALWRGVANNGMVVEPDCPHGNCPGGLLPWPYAN